MLGLGGFPSSRLVSQKMSKAAKGIDKFECRENFLSMSVVL